MKALILASIAILAVGGSAHAAGSCTKEIQEAALKIASGDSLGDCKEGLPTLDPLPEGSEELRRTGSISMMCQHHVSQISVVSTPARYTFSIIPGDCSSVTVFDNQLHDGDLQAGVAPTAPAPAVASGLTSEEAQYSVIREAHAYIGRTAPDFGGHVVSPCATKLAGDQYTVTCSGVAYDTTGGDGDVKTSFACTGDFVQGHNALFFKDGRITCK